MGIFDWKHWVIILIVVVLVFGTRKLKTLGSDLGSAIKGFRQAMNEEESNTPRNAQNGTPLTPPPTQQESALRPAERAETENSTRNS